MLVSERPAERRRVVRRRGGEGRAHGDAVGADAGGLAQGKLLEVKPGEGEKRTN